MIIDLQNKNSMQVKSKDIVIYTKKENRYTIAVINNPSGYGYILIDLNSMESWSMLFDTLEEVQKFFTSDDRAIIDIIKHYNTKLILNGGN